MLKRFLKTTKGKVTAICSGVALVAVVAVVAVMLILNNNKYRSISVADVKGIVNIIGQKNNGQAYKGQRLFDGDDVSVIEDSELTLCLNNDKYVYADENTHFKLEAASSKQGNKLKIVLDKGSELNVLTAKLGDGDIYQVDTPNSTMSVRGTRFRMTVYTGDDGYTYTLLEVQSGIVLAQLKTLTGEYNGVEKEFFAGQSALIRGGDDFSEFVLSEEQEEVWFLDYKSLPSEAVPRLVELLKKGEELEAAAKEAEEKAVTDTDDKDKNQVVEKDADKDKEADKETDADKDKEKEADKDKDAKDSKDGKDKDAKDGKDAKDKDNKDNKETANNDNNNSNGGNDNNGGGSDNNGGGSDNNGGGSDNNGGGNNNTQPDHTHTFGEWKEVTEAKCNSEGLRKRVCSSCGAEETEPIPVDSSKHSWGSWSIVSGQEPTCESGGKEERFCSICGGREERDGTALGHDWTDWHTDKDCTCSSQGEKSHTCNRCGTGEVESIPIDPGKHNWQKTTEIRNEIQDPTTGFMSGSRERKYHCDECGQDEWRIEYFP